MKNKIPYNIIAGYITGNCTPEEAEKVTKWIEESEEHDKVFNEMYEVWEKTGKLREEKEFDAEMALEIISEKMDQNNIGHGNELRLNISRWIGVAASILILAALTFSVVILNSNSKIISVAVLENEEVKKVELNDGSFIWLNSDSKLEYPKKLGRKTREVVLKGEAYFDVAKDPAKPFIIHTLKANIKVLGTSFNVMAREQTGKTVVSVESGKVSFASNRIEEKAVMLEVGEMGVLENNTNELKKSMVDDPNITSWKTGLLIFKDTPFCRSMEDISNYYKKEIVITDSALNNQKFNATFENQSFEVVLKVLRMNSNLEVIDSLGKIIIAKK